MSDTTGSGVVLASFGRGVLVQADGVAAESAPLRCSLQGRRQRIVCGDRVTFVHRAANDGASVASIAPRRNLIERIDARGRPEPVAANIDRLAIVVAPEPAVDWFLVDRYWAGATLKNVPTLLIVNKRDLGWDGLENEMDGYRRLGLALSGVAAASGEGIDELRVALGTGVTLLVGQSGVGKSSLVNALTPAAAALTAELTRDAEGRHTTTTARLYAMPDGGALMDAPGVRDFAPPASLVRAAERGFVEIHARGVECKFNDCRHLEEPGCAVRAGLQDGGIAARRYESYRRLLRLYEKLA